MPPVITPPRRPFRTPAAGAGAACPRPARAAPARAGIRARPVFAAGARARAAFVAGARAGAACAAVGIAVAGAVLLVAGCSSRSASSRGTVSACYAFAVQALDQHATVTSVPPACTGLNHEQINLAADRAIRAVVGPHRKVVARRLAHKEAAYLAYLVTVIPPRAAPPPVTAPARPSSRLPLDVAALAAWAVTVAAGVRLLAGWIVSGGLRRGYSRVAGVPRTVIVGHFTLALTGLAIWIGFLATGLPALAWAGVAAVLSVAGLGMATLAAGLPQARQATGPRGDSPQAMATGPADVAPRAAARTTTIQMPAGQSLGVIALHGVLAASTILLVVLAAIGAG